MPWAAAIAAVGAIGGGLISSNAAGDAADKQAAATARGIADQKRTAEKYFGISQDALKPYASLGTETLPTLKSLLGLGPEGADGMQATLEKFPGYQFAIGEGQKAITNQQIGAGAKYSGNALKAAADYNRNMGAGLFNDYYSKIFGLSGQGLAASTGIANAAMGAGGAIGQTQFQGNQSIGASQAAGIQGQAGAWTNAIDQMVGAGSKVDWSKQFSGGGDGGIGKG